MGRPRSKLSPEEILARRAQAAWEYRQRCVLLILPPAPAPADLRVRHKAAVNEKARLRMRAHRQKLQQAPASVQLEYAVKAAQYRRDYVERARQEMCMPRSHPSSNVRRAPPAKPRRPRAYPPTSSQEASEEEETSEDGHQESGRF
ncbi:hypothetical protein R3P38DRAFT_3194269 [Favolaschia claudopus]|uniref:Uncharacterized protein n=1 Tax=Favolaschia claudopus TaxID=2862362 RepID=A0AAW0BD00_9AGAR